MKEKEIGKVFRSQLNEFTATPSEKVWEKIQNNSSLKSFNRKKRIFNLTNYTIAVMSILVIVAIVLSVNSTTKKPQQNSLLIKKQIINPTDISTISTDTIPEKTVSSSHKENSVVTNTDKAKIVPPTVIKPEISQNNKLSLLTENGKKIEIIEAETGAPSTDDLSENEMTYTSDIPDKIPTEPILPVKIEYSGDTTVCKNSKVVLFVKNSPKVFWHIGIHSPTLEIYPTENAIYYVDIVKPDGKDTTLAISVNIFSCNLYIPNAFTPNGDGLNDEFRVEASTDIHNFEMSVFELSGRLMFHSKNISHGWDGTYEGEKARPGAYLYIITYKDRTGEKHYDKGQIILYR